MTRAESPFSTAAPPIPEVSVVMPALDEEEALPATVAEAVAALDVVCARWELIVVDDGSSDGTPAVLRELADRDDRIRVLTQHGHLGYGLAVRRGFDAARYMVVCTTDADGQYDLRELPVLYPFLRESELVAGIRSRREAALPRRVASRCFNWLQSSTVGIRTRDVNCSFRLYRKSLLHMLDLESDGHLIKVEILAQVQRAGLRWSQVGVTHRPRRHGRSKVGLDAACSSLVGLWRLRRIIRRQERA